MPQTNECDFCGGDIEPGTGTMFVRTDGTTVRFCSSKCEKNADLGRRARDLEWTSAGEDRRVAAEPAGDAEAGRDEEPTGQTSATDAEPADGGSAEAETAAEVEDEGGEETDADDDQADPEEEEEAEA